MNIVTGCATNRGNYRSKNQDSVICLRGCIEERDLVVACVCDGVGSLKNSEIAANLMTDGISKWFKEIIELYPKDISNEEILEDLEITIRELNEIVCDYRIGEGMDIGCTMSLLFIIDKEYYIFQVGDSRVYVLQDALVQLTADDTVAREVKGRMKNLLFNYIGKANELLVSKVQGTIQGEELFLVVSDGVYKKMQPEDISLLKMITQDKILERECNNLLEVIMSRGERDNLSCAVVLFSTL